MSVDLDETAIFSIKHTTNIDLEFA